MKKIPFAILLAVLLSGCATPYHADYSKPQNPDERTNPYQQPVPDNGIASVARDIIRK